MSRLPIYTSAFFLGLHNFLIIYINSSYLSTFVGKSGVNILYSVGALLNICLFFLAPYILSKIKARTFVSSLLLIEFVCILLLGRAVSASVAVPLFILSQAIVPLIIYSLDLYLESTLVTESNTGWMRGIFITCLNTALLIALFTVSVFAREETFPAIYMVSAFAVIPILLIVSSRFSKDVHHSNTDTFSFSNAILFLSRDKDILRILASNLLLQFFYAIMVIYLPFLLSTVPGFSWGEIGAIVFVMILPFLLFELPLARLMDRRSGETEVLRAGFAIMAFATIALAFITVKIYWLWAGILFITRIGACSVEISNESYFFKKVTDRNPNIISLFRSTQSLAYIISPLLALPLLYFTPNYSHLFLALGFVMFLGLLVIPKVDTK
jgi:hypothetical protein